MNFIFVLFMIVYIIGVVAISMKLRDILKNKEKYREREIAIMAEKRIKETKKIKFFQSLTHQYCMLMMPMWILSTGGAAALLRLIYRIIAGENTLILAEAWLAGVIGAMFIMIAVIAVIPLYIKTPFFAVMALGSSNDGTRYSAWRDAFIMLIITFTIGFPFYGFSANNYIYYDDNGITSSAYFQPGETYTAYEDITKVEICAHHNNDGELDALCYKVTLSDGRTIEMAGDSKIFYSESVFELHKKIESVSEAEFEITPLTNEDMTYLQERLSPERMEYVLYIFDGRH